MKFVIIISILFLGREMWKKERKKGRGKDTPGERKERNDTEKEK